MSTQATIAGTVVSVPDGYDLIERMPFDDPQSTSFGREEPGAICHLVLAPVAEADAMPFGDPQPVIDDIHANIDDDQGLIEVDAGETAKGRPYVYNIVRTNLEPGSMHYALRLHLGAEQGVVGVQGAFDTAGSSSYRDSFVMSKLMAGADAPVEGWFADPYDPDFALGNLMNQSELPKYDADFPDHPLTLMRRFVADLAALN